mmetsp:Transcript_5824/g.13779  ORF Transcript_5824/g.13779 Transcript_5824/m.13779 type:complete len:394 (-) Transcript_5824:1095-2276(-)
MVQNTDNLDTDLDDLLSEVRTEERKRSNQGAGSALLNLCFAYCTYTCEYAPRVCLFLGIAGLVVPAYFLVMAALNPTEQFGVIQNDYTDIRSKYDLEVGKISHWCISGPTCRCEDPLQPQARAEFRKWTNAHLENKEAVNKMVQDHKNPDIAFLGASVVEEMDGRWFGNSRDEDLNRLDKLFNKNFKKEQGAELDAVALGIAGDTSPSVLWRLMNGEMPTDFHPKIWWLELGMNDLGRTRCSEEVVILGVLRVVEEILNKKPNANVVINSLLPMAEFRGGFEPNKWDFKDSFFKSIIAEDSNGNGRRRLQEQPRRGLRWFGMFGGDSGKPPKSVRMSADRNKQKKFKSLTRQKRKIPLFTSIYAINAVLRKFASKHDNVYFFDATSKCCLQSM